jgi:hypothetical protein
LANVIKILLFCFLFAGCITAKKAEKKADKLRIKQPEVMAKFTRTHFPCIITKDSVISYVTDDSLWIEVLTQLQGDLWWSYMLQDSLLNELSKDTQCVHFADDIAKLKKENLTLSDKLKNIPPVIKTVEKIRTVEDRAITEPLRWQVDNLLAILLKKDEDIRELKEKAVAENTLKKAWRSRALWTWFLLFVGLAGGYFLRKTFK